MSTQYTVKQLQQICKDNKIKGCYNKKKDVLYNMLLDADILGSSITTKGLPRKEYSQKRKSSLKPMKDYTVSELRDILGCGRTKKELYDTALRMGLLGVSSGKTIQEDILTNKHLTIEYLKALYKDGLLTKNEIENIIYDRWSTDNDVIINGISSFDYFVNGYIKYMEGSYGEIYYDLMNGNVYALVYNKIKKPYTYPMLEDYNSDIGLEIRMEYAGGNTDLIRVYPK